MIKSVSTINVLAAAAFALANPTVFGSFLSIFLHPIGCMFLFIGVRFCY